MLNMPLSPATYIDTQADLIQLVHSLSQETLLAIDTESNSLYAYQERVCLIQLSTRSADYIIDPLMIADMQPLGVLMESPSIQKVFHAAEYDIMCMKRDFDFVFNNLFDTMVAARVCGIKAVGLGSILEKYAGIQMDKSHQRDDWGKRPLDPESLRYAQMDTHFLPYLRDELYNQLETMGRVVEAEEAFEEIAMLPAAPPREFDPDGFWRIGQPNLLKQQEMLILQELYYLREEIAQKENIPSFKVLTNNALVTLAQTAPTGISQLKKIRGISSSQAREYGTRILRAVKRGKNGRHLAAPPRPSLPDPVVADRYTALHAWRRDKALERGVESDVIISKQALWDLAYKAPTSLDEFREIRGLGPWRLAAYGEEILSVLEQCRQLER